MSLVTLVTGGSSGIGAALLRRLAAPGACLLIGGGRRLEAAEALAEELAASGAETEVVLADFTDPASAALLPQAALGRWGRIDRIVHAAGFADRRPVGALDPAGWDRSLAVNASAFFHLVTAALPALQRSKAPRIVAVGSFLGHRVRFERDMLFPATSASKAALAGLVRALAMQLAPDRIPVNAVIPGFIEKDRSAHTALDPAARDRAAHLVPFGRYGVPDEVAAAILFLLGPDSGYITGQCLPVDGGLTL